MQDMPYKFNWLYYYVAVLKNMLHQIWQKALSDSIKCRGKNLWGTKTIEAVGAFSALEVEKSLLTIKP